MHFISLCSHLWPEPAFSFQSLRAVTVLITCMPLRRWRGSIPFSSLPIWLFLFISSVRFSCSVVSDCLRPHGLQHARSPCLSTTPVVYPNSCPLNRWCHPTISFSVAPFSDSVFPSIGVFSNESAVQIRWPKCWSFNFSISPSNEYSGLISFKVDWFDLLSVQRTVKSLLQHLNSKELILQCSAFFMVQLSHPYTTPGKNIALTTWIFVSKVRSLLFTTLSRFVVAFLSRTNRLLTPGLQSLSAVILEPETRWSVTSSTSPSFYLLWRDGAGYHGLSFFFNVEF